MVGGARVRRTVNAIALAPLLGLVGCTTSELVQSLTPAAVPEASEPDYRRIVAENLQSLFPKASLGDLEISALRMVDHFKGPAWIACLKLDAHGTPQYYAIFIQADKVIDSRAGVIVDQCYKQDYFPFDTSPPPPVITTRAASATRR